MKSHDRCESTVRPAARTGAILGFLLLGILPSSIVYGEPPSARLFDSGKEGYLRYRIPCLVTTKSETVLAIAEGRKDGRGLTGNIDIVLKRSRNNGKTWSDLEVIADDGDNTLGNPCAIVAKDGTIWLALTRSLGNETEEAITAGTSKDPTRVWITHSRDDGKTWAKPVDVTTALKAKNWSWYGTGPGTGIQLKSGRLLFPCYHYDLHTKSYRSHAVFSDDNGKTWKRGSPSGATDRQTTECHVAERQDGSLLLSARIITKGSERRVVSLSKDEGATWSNPQLDEALYDPGCEASLIRVAGKDDRSLWLYGHPAGPNGRRNLTVRASHDEGRTWKESRLLRSGDGQYTSLTALPDGTIGCLYDAWVDNNYQIFFTRFSVDWLLGIDKALDDKARPSVMLVPFRLQLDVVSEGFDGKTCWFHPRAGAMPGPSPTVVLTMQKWDIKASDLFLPVQSRETKDLGKTWSPLVEHAGTLGRRPEADGVVVGVCDFTPKWHAASKTLLGTGHSVRYKDDKLIAIRPRETVWSVYDAGKKSWSKWAVLAMPNDLKWWNSGAGSTQRVDRDDGDILLPVYAKPRDGKAYFTTIVRCQFDGKELKYVENGSELSVNIDRGLYEPSLTRFQGKYYLTMRNDRAGYIAVSDDGLKFSAPKKWTFDDGADLGNYNTQQHWITHSDGLFLVYTRRGAQNDHVIRHRAPLFMAQVDPVKLVVIKATERELVPNKGAQLGNFAVVDVNEKETWVTTSEGMSPRGSEKYGANGRVYAARLIWEKPNRSWNER